MIVDLHDKWTRFREDLESSSRMDDGVATLGFPIFVMTLVSGFIASWLLDLLPLFALLCAGWLLYRLINLRWRRIWKGPASRAVQELGPGETVVSLVNGEGRTVMEFTSDGSFRVAGRLDMVDGPVGQALSAPPLEGMAAELAGYYLRRGEEAIKTHIPVGERVFVVRRYVPEGQARRGFDSHVWYEYTLRCSKCGKSMVELGFLLPDIAELGDACWCIAGTPPAEEGGKTRPTGRRIRIRKEKTT